MNTFSRTGVTPPADNVVDENTTGNENTDNNENVDGNENVDSNETTEEIVKAAPEANIVFVGDGEPMTKINNGMETIKLPSVEEQGKPFFHKQAGVIIQLFPGDYKRFVKKGQ